jgi:hypothetical protein
MVGDTEFSIPWAPVPNGTDYVAELFDRATHRTEDSRRSGTALNDAFQPEFVARFHSINRVFLAAPDHDMTLRSREKAPAIASASSFSQVQAICRRRGG